MFQDILDSQVSVVILVSVVSQASLVILGREYLVTQVSQATVDSLVSPVIQDSQG